MHQQLELYVARHILGARLDFDVQGHVDVRNAIRCLPRYKSRDAGCLRSVFDLS